MTTKYAWEEILVLETAIDDMNPEFYPYIIERLLSAGARDAYLQPIIMKKGRPGVMLTALVHQQHLDVILGIIFTETSTLGIRVHSEERACLTREIQEVLTQYGPVRVKVAYTEDGIIPVRLSPEFEDCRALAREKNIPIREVYNSALLAVKNMGIGDK